MNEPSRMNPEATPPSRRPMVVLALLFVVPLAIAFILYYGADWRPATSTEHGDLISPARPLPEIALPTADGSAGSPKFLLERWSLVFVGDGRCLDRCRAALADMQRAREMLGKDISRVQSVFLATGQCCDTQLPMTYPNLVVARADGENAGPMMALFPTYNEVPVVDAGRIYIVDPLGNLMMSYPSDATGIGMYEDLKKLLKLSHIG
jgi:hypothetical protein